MLHDIGNGAMNAPRCLQLRNDVCGDVETSVNTPLFSYPYGAMNFMPPLGLRDPNSNSQQPTAVRDGAES